VILDRALRQRQAEGKPVRVALVGAGFMGRGFVNQVVNSVPGMELVAIANRTPANAERAFREAGVVEWEVVDDAQGVAKAIARGVPAITTDYAAVTGADGVDAVVEATGAVEFGARVVLSAIEHGKHVVLLNAEVDGTAGSILRQRAEAAGVVLTGCDGDQPGVQLYAGNFMDGTMVGKSGKIYRQGDGIALEPQHFPDAPNKPQFAPVRLDPGQTYRNVMVFKLSVAK
jgi:predicted homoserine dehydrogenase-like protein